MNKSHKFNKSGFTLIELLVVVLIIGILSSVALPQYTKSVEKARATQAMIYADAWIKANTIYKLENDKYVNSPWDYTGISKPTLKESEWSSWVTISIGGTVSANMKLQRELANAEDKYALSVNMVSRSGEQDFAMKFCTGNEKMCKTINGGAGNCSENGSPSDPAWCYTTKSSFK